MKKEGTIDLRGLLIHHSAWSSSKKYLTKGLFNTIFFLDPQNETALLLQKKVNDDRCRERMRFATETLSVASHFCKLHWQHEKSLSSLTNDLQTRTAQMSPVSFYSVDALLLLNTSSHCVKLARGDINQNYPPVNSMNELSRQPNSLSACHQIILVTTHELRPRPTDGIAHV